MSLIETKCLLCGSETLLKHDKYPGYQEPLTFQIFHCQVCKTAFSLPRLDDTKELYDNIYTNAEEVPGYGRYRDYAEKVKKVKSPLHYLSESENTYWAISEALTMFVTDKSSAKILEVGSGLGYLTYALNEGGYNCFGIDISEMAVRQAIQDFGGKFSNRDLFEMADEYPGYYDVVILTEVLEHVNEPLIFLKTIMNLLRPGGLTLMTTPNRSIYSELAIWATDNPPVHCWWFSEDSISYLANMTNSDLTFIDFSKYYQKHFTSFEINPISTSFTLDIMGKVIPKHYKETRISSFKKMRGMVLRIFPFLERIYILLNNINKPGVIFLKQRSPVMCAILHKKFV